MTEFENNVRLLRYYQKDYQLFGHLSSLNRATEYARKVDTYIDELVSPSIKFEQV